MKNILILSCGLGAALIHTSCYHPLRYDMLQPVGRWPRNAPSIVRDAALATGFHAQETWYYKGDYALSVNEEQQHVTFSNFDVVPPDVIGIRTWLEKRRGDAIRDPFIEEARKRGLRLNAR